MLEWKEMNDTFMFLTADTLLLNVLIERYTLANFTLASCLLEQTNWQPAPARSSAEFFFSLLIVITYIMYFVLLSGRVLLVQDKKGLSSTNTILLG